MESRYYHLNDYLKNLFNEKVLKICINADFSCPNRDGKCGYGGCIFCSESGSGEHLKKISISNQVETFLKSYKGKRANKFIVYFQNFSNTYDNISSLKLKYDSALISDKIVGISIATRPDCIDEEIVKLISSYKDKYYVCVELGLQTANDETALLINRCYKTKVFKNAVQLLHKYNIPVVTHIMIGLPNEKDCDVLNTIKLINDLNIEGIKIHSTYVVKNTKLCQMYENKKYSPILLEDYIKTTCLALSFLNPNIVIHRLSGDAPKEILVAPDWNLHKKWILNGINKYLKEHNIYQGMNFNK